MSVTITQVKRAFEEVAKQQPGGPVVSPLDRQALIRLSGSTLVLTLMANSINQKLGADLIVAPTPVHEKCINWQGKTCLHSSGIYGFNS